MRAAELEEGEAWSWCSELLKVIDRSIKINLLRVIFTNENKTFSTTQSSAAASSSANENNIGTSKRAKPRDTFSFMLIKCVEILGAIN